MTRTEPPASPSHASSARSSLLYLRRSSAPVVRAPVAPRQRSTLSRICCYGEDDGSDPAPHSSSRLRWMVPHHARMRRLVVLVAVAALLAGECESGAFFFPPRCCRVLRVQLSTMDRGTEGLYLLCSLRGAQFLFFPTYIKVLFLSMQRISRFPLEKKDREKMWYVLIIHFIFFIIIF